MATNTIFHRGMKNSYDFADRYKFPGPININSVELTVLFYLVISQQSVLLLTVLIMFQSVAVL